MESLKYIFAQPEYIESIGEIFPIQLKDYEQFQDCSFLLHISRSHFEENSYPLLALLFMSKEQLGLNYKQLVEKLKKLFFLVTHCEFNFIETNENVWFEHEYLDINNIMQKHYITFENYDILRQTIMKQNLMFEQKIYKDKLVQEWANKVLMSRQKNSIKATIEDYITTVSVYKGKNYDELMNYTIYQLYADFYRIGKIKQFEQSSLFATVSSEPVNIQHFAESVDMFKSPYDDLFVSSDKLNKFNAITN